MEFEWGAIKPVFIESEAVPRGCLLMIQPPKNFVTMASSFEDQLFEFLIACKPRVITNIGFVPPEGQ